MKITTFNRFLVATALFAMTVSAHAANIYWDGGAIDIDDLASPPNSASAGGAGTWNTTLKNWDDGTAAHVAWDNLANNTAILAGTVGTVTMGAAITVGSLNMSVADTVANGGFDLTVNGTGVAISSSAATTISGAGTINVGAIQTWANTTGVMNISCPVNTGTNLLTLNTGNNNLDVSGKISGNGGLTINTTGVSNAIGASNGGTPLNPTLNNTNDYTGTTTVSGFIWLNSGGLGALGTDTSDVILNSGGFRLTGSSTITRGFTISGNSGISQTSGTVTLANKITGTGNFNISGNFAATVPFILTNANDFVGDCTIGPDGTARLQNVNALSMATLAWVDNNNRSVFDLTTNNLAYVFGGIKTTAAGLGNINLGTGLGSGGSGSVSFGNNNQSNTYAGVISGSAGFNKIGTGTQILTGPNTYTGPTTVSLGELMFGPGASLGNSDFTVASGATLGVLGLSMDGQVNCKSLTLASGTTTTDFNYYSTVPSTTTAPLQVNGDLINNGTMNVVISGGAFVAGGPDIPLIKYTGSMTLGTLGSVTALNGVAGTLIDNTGNQTIDLHVTTGNQIIWNAGTGTWDVNITANWVDGLKYLETTLPGNAVLFDDTPGGAGPFVVTISGPVNPSFVTVNNPTKDYSFSGAITGTTGLFKAGAGKLTLLTANTFTGGTTVTDGTLFYGVANALSTGPLTVNGATAILNMDTRSDTVGTITLDGGGQITSTSGTLTSTASFEMKNGTVNEVLAGNGIILNKTGAGTVTLLKANTYTGLTNVTAGTLAYGIANALSNGPVTVNGPTAILSMGAFSDSVGIVTVNGGGQITGSGILTTGTSFEMMNGSASVILEGAKPLNKTTAGTVTLSGANTYTGATTIIAGTLKLGAAGSGANSPLGTTAGATNISTAGGALDLNGFTLVTGEALTLRGTGVSNGGALMNSSSTAATYSGLLTLGAASSIVAGSGDIILSNIGTIGGVGFALTLDGAATGSSIASSIGTGAGTLTKTGTGTWTLGGPNTYTGKTTVSQGTLALADGGAISSTVIELQSPAILNVSAVTGGTWSLAATKTLQGTGTITGTTATAGIIAPGLSGTGTLNHTGDLTLTGTYNCELDGATCDLLAVTGSLTLTGATLTIATVNPPTAVSYVIATYTGAAPAFTTVNNVPVGFEVNYATPGQIRLVNTVSPAYSQWALDKGLTPANNGKSQDPDNDGTTNLLEFALGGNPLSGADNGKSLVKVQNVLGTPALTLTIAVRSGATFASGANNDMEATVDATTYRIEGSANLTTWTRVILETSPAIPLPAPDNTPPAGYEYHTFYTTGPVSTTPADFIRLHVTD